MDKDTFSHQISLIEKQLRTKFAPLEEQPLQHKQNARKKKLVRRALAYLKGKGASKVAKQIITAMIGITPYEMEDVKLDMEESPLCSRDTATPNSSEHQVFEQVYSLVSQEISGQHDQQEIHEQAMTALQPLLVNTDLDTQQAFDAQIYPITSDIDGDISGRSSR